ncbi:MAG TPA: hypothetical protein VGI03_08455 [Verrucomicrobiae bacterium]|jgi:hypothetical protein
MNRDEAKNILLLYRSEADATDPQIASALSFMKTDSDLREWFEGYSAHQKILCEKLRKISPPPGLLEQIISERIALAEKNSRRDKIVASLAMVAIVAALVIVAGLYYPRGHGPAAPDSFAGYESQMLNVAGEGYSMTFATNDLTQVRNYLAQNKSPADYTLPDALEKTTTAGCTIQNFMGANVSMICFTTGKPLPPNHPGDLWLFVAPANALKDSPASATPQLAEVSGMSVATWSRDGKFYLLATPGNSQEVQKYL